MTSVDNAPWRPTPINGHPGGRLPDSFLAEHPRAQYDHSVADFTRRYDDPCVAKFRAELEATNGIPGLELVEPHQVERAAELFARDGFVAVQNALNPEQLATIKAATDRVVEQILASDPQALSGSGPGRMGKLPLRYSFGGVSASGHHMHDPAWVMLIDLPTTTPILKAIFQSDDYYCGGGGGDVCLPGAIECQRLHADLLPMPGSHDIPGCPVLTINFAVTDLTPTNGPIRQIPGTHRSPKMLPRLHKNGPVIRQEMIGESAEEVPVEAPWMRLSTVCPAPAGTAIFRDNRAWHSGTPNLSREVRSLPNIEYFAPNRADHARRWGDKGTGPSMPYELWEQLSEHGKHICREIVAPKGAVVLGAGFISAIDGEKAAYIKAQREQLQSKGKL